MRHERRSYAGTSSPTPELPRNAFGVCFVLLMGFGLLCWTVLSIARAAMPSHLPDVDYAPPVSVQVDVTSVSIALDWNARARMQASLDGLARGGGGNTAEARVERLHAVVKLLLDAQPSWLAGGALNASPQSKQSAQQLFQRAALDARARYGRETVRAEASVIVTSDAPAPKPRVEEGPGCVVVTVVVAARRELLDLRNKRDATQLRAALLGLSNLSASGLVAYEVIWSPSAPNDRMTTAELELRYPELGWLDPKTVAGRVFCGYCGTPFARELGACPACRAPLLG